MLESDGNQLRWYSRNFGQAYSGSSLYRDAAPVVLLMVRIRIQCTQRPDNRRQSAEVLAYSDSIAWHVPETGLRPHREALWIFQVLLTVPVQQTAAGNH